MAFIDPDDEGVAVASKRSTAVAPRRFVDPDEIDSQQPKELWGGPLGIVDAAANIATGMGASAVGGLAGAGTFLGGLTSGASAADSLEAANKNLSSIQDKFTWQPRTVEGKAISHVAALPFEYATKGGQWLGEAAGKPFGLEDEGGLVGNLAVGTGMTLLGGRSTYKNANKIGPAAQAAFEAAKREARGLRTPDVPGGFAPSKLAELQAASIENAPMLDATQAAQRIGGKLDPAVSNPTKFNQVMSMASGEGLLDNMLSTENAATWGKAGAQELGIRNLSVPELKAGRARAGVPYQEVKAIPNVASGAEVQAAIEGVMARDGMTPAVADLVFKDVSPLVTKIVSAAEGGVNGADIVNLTRKLRKDANTVYKQEFPTPEALAKADASLSISRSLEDLTAKRLEVMNKEMPGRGYGDLADRWSAARQYIANSHAWENATNAATGRLDPRKFAKITAKDNALTGVAADVGKIANNMPGIAKNVTEQRLLAERAARYGVPSIAGWGLGAMVGTPGAGAMLGMAAGMIAPPLLRRMIASDKYQAKNAFPKDYRPVAEPNPNIVQWERPGPVPSVPGIGLAPEPEGIDFNAFAQDYRARKAMDSKAPETFISREQAADWFRKDRQERSARIAAEANRQPASGGMPMDLDPITARLRAADQGLKGATPATIESTGNNLSSAVEKISSGQKFAMSSEERIAWDKSKVDLGKAAPGLRGLSDDAIASRVANREWVANRIQELKTEYADWAKGAGERFRAEQAGKINERANNPPVLSGAERQMRKLMNSEAARRMELNQKTRQAEMQAQIDLLESMSDSLASPRASSVIDVGQGPKTRQALRDLLQQ